jgi:hypothetical protein
MFTPWLCQRRPMRITALPVSRASQAYPINDTASKVWEKTSRALKLSESQLGDVAVLLDLYL